jgi:fibronectin-binding autotransporter adhesin
VDQASITTTTPITSGSTTSASCTTTVSGGSFGVFVWTGATGNSQWGTAGNWNTGSVPGSGNDAVIPAGTPLAIAGGTVTIHNLDLEGQLEADGSFGANNVTLGGTLTGSGQFSVGGALTWTGGAMTGTGTTSIGSGAGLIVSGSGTKALNGRTLDNAGTATWSGSDITAGSAATIINEANATFTLNGSPNLVDSSGTSTFLNDGTFTKSSDGGESDFGASFQNGGTGTVAVNGGTLGFGNGGSSSGTFQIAGGAAAAVKGGAFGLGGLVLGTGQLVIGSGVTTQPATVTMGGGTTNVQNVVLVAGGTLAGSGELDIGTSLQWSAGTISGELTVVVVQGATGTITGIDSKLISGSTFTNDGSVTWNGGKLGLELSGEFQNYGTLTATGSLTLDVGASTGTLKNGGQIVQSGGILSINSLIQTTASSSFNVQAGGGINFTGVAGTLEGSFTAAAGTQVSFAAGDWNLQDVVPDTMFGGDGNYILQGATTTFTVDTGDSVRARYFAMQGGELKGGGDFGAVSFSWAGGKMSGAGRTYEKDGDLMTISGGFAGDRGVSHTLEQRTLLNQGTVNWGPGAGDILLAQNAQIITDGNEGEGVFEAWANSTILPDNPNTTTSVVLVENGGQFSKPADEYFGTQWTSVKVTFQNTSGTVHVDGSLVATDYEQAGGSTEVGGMGNFTVLTLPNPATPTGITAGTVTVSGVLSFASNFTMWGGTFLLAGGSIQTNTTSTPGGSGSNGADTQLSLGPNATLSGSGTVYAALYNYGVIAPSSGDFFGHIVIAGTYRQFGTGSLQLRLGGSAGNDSFQVTAEGVLPGDLDDLGGTLQVTLVDGLMPSSGAEFNVFAWAGTLGTADRFDNSVLIGPGGNIAHQTNYNADSVSFLMQ